MNNITQMNIFNYTDIEILGDLERLVLFFDNFDDKGLIKLLNDERRNGRNDYPVEMMFKLVIAMKIYGHRTVDSFRRELSRNPSLRKIWVLMDEDYQYLGKRKNLVPPARVFTLFFKKLIIHRDKLDEIFNSCVEWMQDNLKDFGKDVAIDGKIIETYANKVRETEEIDNRADYDASHTCKQYHFKDGTTKKTWFFGYRAHIMCDANYGLPIAYKVTTAKISEQKLCDELIENLSENRPKILEDMENFIADAGYDNGERNRLLKKEYNINPIVDIRHMWKNEELREIENQMLAYNQDGEVFYINDITTGEYEKLIYIGYDKQRECLRYRHEAKPGVYRIPLKTDYRIFTPVARDSKKFEKLYNKRSEVERLNGRIDRDYMFNDHFIREEKKLDMMLTLTFIIMLTMSKGHIKNKSKNIRSLIKI